MNRGVEVAFVDACQVDDVKKAVTSATRLVWLEVMMMMMMVMVMKHLWWVLLIIHLHSQVLSRAA